MNFFRSEEHLNNWPGYDKSSETAVVQPLSDWMERFSNPRFSNRGNSDYISWRSSQDT